MYSTTRVFSLWHISARQLNSSGKTAFYDHQRNSVGITSAMLSLPLSFYNVRKSSRTFFSAWASKRHKSFCSQKGVKNEDDFISTYRVRAAGRAAVVTHLLGSVGNRVSNPTGVLVSLCVSSCSSYPRDPFTGVVGAHCSRVQFFFLHQVPCSNKLSTFQTKLKMYLSLHKYDSPCCWCVHVTCLMSLM